MKVTIIGYRTAGLDGVSLETNHWINILESMGHKVTLVAGELDRAGIVIPELHFKWPQAAQIHDRVVYGDENYEKIEREIFTIAGIIEGKLRELFRNGSRPDLLIVPNVLSLPIHFPFAVALARTISEFNIKTLARHHDFWWERRRYQKSDMFHFFKHWFPPNTKNIHHIVINSIARDELKKRTGISADIIGDSFDFNSNLNAIDDYSESWRRDFGIADDDVVFLQATRVVPRKRIELAIELVQKLNSPNVVLVIAGKEGDEASGYMDKLKQLAKSDGARVLFIGDRVNSHRKIERGRKIYTLWDCFINADFSTYPTLVEGYGNQFIESVYFRKPIIVTPYEVYNRDIKPLGFETIEMTPKISKALIKKIQRLIANPELVELMTEKNFRLGQKHLSYQATEKKLHKMFKKMKLE